MMEDFHFKIDGWIYQHQAWTNAFKDETFKSICTDDDRLSKLESNLSEQLIFVDLECFTKHSLHRDVEYALDELFTKHRKNIKEDHSNSPIINSEGPSWTTDPVYAEAMISLINIGPTGGTYVYFNMTSYAFWNDIYDWLLENDFNCNLGGWWIKIGEFDKIDVKLVWILKDYDHKCDI